MHPAIQQQKQDLEDLKEAIAKWHGVLKSDYGLTRWELPKLQIGSLMASTTAGEALLRQNIININWGLYVRNKKDFLEKRTCLHECVHLADFRVNGHRMDMHDFKFKQMMVRYGGSPTACHNYDVNHLKAQKPVTPHYVYKCVCGVEALLDASNHLRMGRGRHTCNCKKCGKVMGFTGETKKA